MKADLTGIVRVMPGDPVTGLRCEPCELPSVVSVPVYVLSDSGVTLHAHASQCGHCGNSGLIRYGRHGT